MDALRDGFEVMVMRDCTRGVNIQRNDSAEALRLMKNSGARIVTSTGAIKGIQRAAMKSSS
jgi:nicotinamidase-related amidase